MSLQKQELIESRRVLDRRKVAPVIREFSKINNFKGAVSILRQWAVIVAVFYGASYFEFHWIALVFGILIVATRQHALGIIMHDATHYRLFSHLGLNDWMSDFFCAFPIGLTTEGYRFEHLRHHVNTNTDNDPYWILFKEDSIWHWPKTPSKAIFVFLGDLLGWNAWKNLLLIGRWSAYRKILHPKLVPGLSRIEVIRLVLFFSILVPAIWYFNLFFPILWLWILPAFTVTILMTRVRTIAEHLALDTSDELSDTRHVDGTWIERLTIAPLNINYHIDHHMFPSVPQYNLPKLHKELLKNQTYCSRAKLVPNYMSFKKGVFSELIKK